MFRRHHGASFGFLFLSVIIFTTSCDQATGAAVGAISSLTKLVSAVNSIPTGQKMLPPSLQDKPKPSHARALGDVTTLDPTLVAGVRSEGYVRLQKEIGESILANIIQAFQAGMSSLASMEYGTAFALGDVTLTKDQAAVLGVAQKFDAGKAIAAELPDGSVDVKWHFGGSGNFRLPNSATKASAGDYDYYLHLVIAGIGDISAMAATIAFMGTQTLTAPVTDDGNGNSYPSGTKFSIVIRGKYDAAAGSQTALFDPVTNDQGIGNETTGRYEALAVAGGETSLVDIRASRFNVAWGDADQGGVLAKGQWSDGSVSLNQYRCEIYNGSGELVKESIASDQAGKQFAFLEKLDDGAASRKTFFNLHDAAIVPPSSGTFYLKAYETWPVAKGGARTLVHLYYSTSDDAASWAAAATDYATPGQNPAPWIVINKAGAAWAAGDQVYFNHASGHGSDANGDYNVYEYNLDFTYPTPSVLYAGDVGTYYQRSSFPLKHLRLDNSLAGFNYVIRSEEEAPVTITAQDGAQLSTPTYKFWLQKPPSGSTTLRTDNIGFYPNLGDLELSNALHLKEFWVWDPSAQARSSVQAYVVHTTQPLPPAFQLAPAPDSSSQAPAAIIGAVEAQFAALAATALGKQADLTQASLDAAAATLGVAAIATADLAGYPR